MQVFLYGVRPVSRWKLRHIPGKAFCWPFLSTPDSVKPDIKTLVLQVLSLQVQCPSCEHKFAHVNNFLNTLFFPYLKQKCTMYEALNRISKTGPWGWWLIGSIPGVLKEGIAQLNLSLSAQYGPVFKVSYAKYAVVAVADPELAR